MFIGICSPAFYIAQETALTLHFIQNCKKIKNEVKRTQKQDCEATMMRLLGANYKKPMVVKKEKVLIPWSDYKPDITQYLLKTEKGVLCVLDNQMEDTNKDKLIILMHGCPSDC
jgi:pimeloyl-ACP methyl ester carboxylesterase